MGFAVVAAVVCVWSTLCLLFWQGSWQLLYHPRAAVTWTPANAGLPFDSIGFAATPAGTPQLRGWWIPAEHGARFTAIYLHDASGNLGDCKNALVNLHDAGLNVFAFDYRGYGMSRFARPTEMRWNEDAGFAIDYLVNTRHIPASSLVLYGQGLGANLALDVATAHAELAGVVLDAPIETPMNATFSDPRAKLVPAHLLVRDRWDAEKAAGAILIPTLWLTRNGDKPQASLDRAYNHLTARKEHVWVKDSQDSRQEYLSTLTQWLDDLPKK